jgi:hypothetical protein
MKNFLILLFILPMLAKASGDKVEVTLIFSTQGYSESNFSSDKLYTFKKGENLVVNDFVQGFLEVEVDGIFVFIPENHIKFTKEYREYKTQCFEKKRKKSLNK